MEHKWTAKHPRIPYIRGYRTIFIFLFLIFLPKLPGTGKLAESTVMKLGEKIKLLRTEEEMTQPALAEKAGIEQSYLSKLENEKAVPSFDIINRIAMALGTTAMELINSLSQSYIEDHLAHIPEVAAEYAAIRSQQEARMKKRFVRGAACTVLGVGIFLLGYFAVIFPEMTFTYQSDGIVGAQELVMQFYPHTIDSMSETVEEAKTRLRSNRERIAIDFLVTHKFLGEQFIADVTGGRRYYYEIDRTADKRTENGIVCAAGAMLIASGLFIFLFNFHYRQR